MALPSMFATTWGNSAAYPKISIIHQIHTLYEQAWGAIPPSHPLYGFTSPKASRSLILNSDPAHISPLGDCQLPSLPIPAVWGTASEQYVA